MTDEQEFFAACWASYKNDVAKLLRRKGMTPAASIAAVSQLNEAACGDLNPAQCASRIIQGATK